MTSWDVPPLDEQSLIGVRRAIIGTIIGIIMGIIKRIIRGGGY